MVNTPQFQCIFCRHKEAHNAREHSLSGGGETHIKQLTPQEEHAWDLLGFSTPGVCDGGDIGFPLGKTKGQLVL